MAASRGFFLALLATALAPTSGQTCECYYSEGACVDYPCVQVNCFHVDTPEEAECVQQMVANMTATVNPSSVYFLNFEDNNLDLFPDDLLASVAVAHFDISFCAMSGFPHRLLNPVCPTMLKLAITDSVGINSISDDGFTSCPLLWDIFLQDDFLEDVSPRAFVGVDNLLTLTINYNSHLASFRGLEGLVHLTTLNLEQNHMDVVDKNALGGLPAAVDVYLNSNNLTTLEEGTFDPINRNRTHVHLEGNPFYCNCSMAWLKEWISGDDFYDNVTCEGPVKGYLKSMTYLDDC